MALDSSIVLGWVVNALISFSFGVLGGLVSHILIREYDRRANESERLERMRRRILLPSRRIADAVLRKLFPTVGAIVVALVIGILTGSVWAMLGVAAVMGLVIGRLAI